MNCSIINSKLRRENALINLLQTNVIDKAKKAPNKADICIQLIALHEEHEALKVENKKNLEIIENLKTKVADKEKDHSLIKADNKSMENVQNKCEYVADSEGEHDLDAHVFSEDCG